MIRVVRPLAAKLFVAALLALCIGVQVLEASGRWDRTLQDANDEAGIVAIVLCVGFALEAAGALLMRLHTPRSMSRIVLARTAPFPWSAARFALAVSCGSPPVRLRI